MIKVRKPLLLILAALVVLGAAALDAAPIRTVTATITKISDGDICFFLKDGTRIVNFPKKHSENCTAKHTATNQWFKPTVRIYKNMRNYLVNSNILRDGTAPSYFIEGMLWNVPGDMFGKSYDDTFVATFNYLVNSDRSTFKCANGIHPLLQEDSHVSWSPANCQVYLSALRNLWNNWS